MSKLLALIATAALIVFGLMFSAVLLLVIVTAGGIAFAYLWWKTRTLRRLMREQAMGGVVNPAEAFKGEVYEGEIIEGEVKVVSIDEIRR